MSKYSWHIRQFIEEQIDLIDNNEWVRFYDILNNYDNEDLQPEIGTITEMLLEAEIDPLNELSIIPEGYLCNTSITHFKCPNHIKDIGKEAFYDAEKLEFISLPEGLIKIEDAAFCGCTSLTTITLPNTLRYMGFNVFYNCESLTEVIYRGPKEVMEDLIKIRHLFNHNGITIKCIDGDITL